MSASNPVLNIGTKCPVCGDDEAKRATCPACGGRGIQVLTCCPFKAIPEDIWIIMDLCEHAMHGAWPMSGGVLDQAQAFVDVVGVYRDQREYWKAKHSNGG